ncbi:MAG: NAD-dependent epimerase/dehydratase family protein [Phycisphaerales bacterium]|nr:NAD-dependent epimerase/dehydratase family protein [Phycisphaerales bacterium]
MPHAIGAHHTSPVPTGQQRATAILVTGAGGEMGHGLLCALDARRKHDGGCGTDHGPLTVLIAVDIRELAPEIRAHCDVAYVGDICDHALLERLLAMYEISEIYHLAALLSTRGEFAPETAHHVNVGGTLNLLHLAAEQARSHGRTVKFFFPSSIAVYGLPTLDDKRRVGRVREDEWCEPHTMYGCNKLSGEHLGRYYDQHYRKLAKDRIERPVDFRSIRFPGIISAETLPSGGTSDYGPEMIHAAAASRPYRCFVRGDSRIPFMTMPEAIDATLALMSAPKECLTRSAYNIASFSPSAEDFRQFVQQAFPLASIEFESDPGRQSIVDSWPIDCDDSAARRDWGWVPRHTAESAFREYLLPRIAARYLHSSPI